MFLHAATGCDTTSAFFGKGKKAVISSVEKKSINSHLKIAIEAFKRAGQSHDTIFENGIKFLLFLYGAPAKTTSIDEYRYVAFAKAVANNTKSLKPVKLESLPPTSDAARQHFYRVYLQVQKWMSYEINPEKWGWEKSTTLNPILMKQQPAPDEILNMIFCTCKSGCIKDTCTCRKSGLQCSNICKSCSTDTCKNFPITIGESEIEFEDYDESDENNKDDDKDSDEEDNYDDINDKNDD